MLTLIIASLIALMVTVGFTVFAAKYPNGDAVSVFWFMLFVSGFAAGIIVIGSSVIYSNVADRDVVKHEVVNMENVGDTYLITLKDGTKKVLEDKDDSQFEIALGDDNILTEKKKASSQVFFDLNGASYKLEIASSLREDED